MSKRDIDSLLNRGKHYVCQYITSGCYEPATEKSLDGPIVLGEKHLQNHDHRRVHHVIDHLFDYRHRFSADELVEWIKYMIGGRRLPNNFAKEVKSYDTSSKCGLVWTTNFVAYRCRTCAISLCMSLCTDCFLNGNHVGHDFNMFRSQAGGACDCGDSFVMKEEGFCTNHQSKCHDHHLKKAIPPNSLLCIANEMVPRLLYYLVLYLRENNFPHNKKANALLSDVFIYLNDLGTMMQDIICKALTDPNLYKRSLNSVNKEDDLDYQHRIRTLAENYRRAVQEIQLSSIFPDVDTSYICEPELIKDIESFNSVLEHKSFLDEIIFWTILNEFPSNLITFLLKMLPDEDYKTQFAESFVKHYFRISMLILHPTERFIRNSDRDIFYNKLANSVVHVSVQLFSNENLALLLCERLKLLYIIIISLKFAIEGNRKNYWGILVPNVLLNRAEQQQQPEQGTTAQPHLPKQQLEIEYTSTGQLMALAKTEQSPDDDQAPADDSSSVESVPRVVCCDHNILRLHRFWPIVSDLNNLFTHERIALSFLRDEAAIDLWLEFIMSFQGMNLNKKLTEADDDNLHYKAAYLSELEICASQMWTLISHLKDESTRELTVNIAKHSLKWLQTWLEPIKLNLSEIDSDRCTFHLPLHRYFSVFMHHAVMQQNVALAEILPEDDIHQLKSLLVHPLQTLIAHHHILAGLWMSNGLQIKTQAINYMQPHFCNSTIDADIFLLQQIVTRLVPNEFVNLFAASYGLKPYMYIYPITSPPMDQDKLISFLENAFTFLAILVSQHNNLGLSTDEVTRKEMTALLAIGEKTHSQIHDMLPYKCGYTQGISFIETLNDIAVYKSPEVEASGGLVQGYFYIKNEVWEKEFDPLFILYRNAYRRDFQTTLTRFASSTRSTGKYTSNSLPWPPFRIPPPVSGQFIDPRCILRSKVLHSFYFSIFVKAINETPMVTQHLLSIVIYLMELTIIEDAKKESNFDGEVLKPKTIDAILEADFENWFPSDDLIDNFLVTMKKFQTSELKFENDGFKAKFLQHLFNSLLHDDYHVWRGGEEGVDSPTVIFDEDENEENADGVTERVDLSHLNHHMSWATEYLYTNDNEETRQQIEEQFSYLRNLHNPDADEDDDDDYEDEEDEDEENMHFIHRTVGGERMQVGGSEVQVTINRMDGGFNQPSSSSSGIGSSGAGGSGAGGGVAGGCSSAPKVSFARTKPLRFEYDVDESFLSILLKLYSQLNEKRDSFKTDSASLATFDLSSRIGDGPYFIGCLLKRYMLAAARRIELQKQSQSIDQSDNVQPSSEECLAQVVALVDAVRRQIWPNMNAEASSGSLQSQATSSSGASNEEAKPADMDVDMEEIERQEKKRRALELKKQIMNKFRTMQNAFIENNKSEMDDGSEKDEKKTLPKKGELSPSSGENSNDSSSSSEENSHQSESQVKYEPKSYQCVICGLSGFSTLERPFAQVVLLQSTSVLGNAQAHTLSEELAGGESVHEEPSSSSAASTTTTTTASLPSQSVPPTSYIPTNDDEQAQFTERLTFGNFFEQRLDTLYSEFSIDSWLRSVSIGWCGGVHTSTCSHFIHIDCFQSYITSVYQQSRESSDLIEYSCPLCRKTANSVLPIIPNFANLYALVKSRSNSCPRGVAIEIQQLLSNCDMTRLANSTQDESKFLKVLAMTIEDVMKATEPQYRNIRVDPSPQSLFLFLSSISRTNLEYNILLWRDKLRNSQQTSCFIHLFQALSLNAKLVLPMHYTRLWTQITGIDEDDDSGDILLPYEKHVPLLLKDVSAILLQLLYALPFNIDKAYFISISQALLNLNFVQALVLIAYHMSPEQRAELSSKATPSGASNNFETIFDYIAFIMNNGNSNSLTTNNFLTVENQFNLNEDIILSLIAKICLPFLRVASILYHLLYLEATLPEYQSIANCSSPVEEFTTLTTFLHLNSYHRFSKPDTLELTNKEVQFFHPFINWIGADPSPLMLIWCKEFDRFVQKSPIAAKSLIKQNFIITHRPRLLQLPASYDQLFMFYHKRVCHICNTVPKDASICLICGRLVCIRDNCCRSNGILEGVAHSKKCGAGTAIYLAINSSSIIVIRGKKACIWGSVYLDEFGEEDRDLKRGKPLYLCNERYRALEQQWLTHSFLHINKKWVYHKDQL